MDLLLREDKVFLVKIMAVMIVLASAVILLGWVFELFDIFLYPPIMPQWIGVRFSASLSFLFSGLLLLQIARAHQSRHGDFSNVMAVSCMGIFLIIIGMLFTSFYAQTSVDQMLLGNAANAIKGDLSAAPSIGAMVAFSLIALVGVLSMINLPKPSRLFTAGLVVAAIGGMSVAGYFLNIPILCLDLAGVCTGMELTSSVLFFMLGLGFVILGTIRKRPGS
ncbi:hypothetical protein Ga0123462_1456 [Mariprofundus ferrinatatus]|uniref:Uncharacterized protein n=1 Tax=Mariprofundus ferrinatatus TaxID=1921087 RepID=A0A2K8L7U4_9PROT|nr:hypothetical protein [Mariprofundus ferrinatatus]ATX82319.1 hypothetical protein Ga0123462_1456 [Mariprofundus ferrinatatus]